MGPNDIPRIFIVESYGSQLKSLSNHISSLAFQSEIVTAPDGETALARLNSEPADLAIIDTLLRGRTDGFELCRALRLTPSHQELPIILLLAGHLSLERLKGMQVGANILLHRPIVKEELLGMVRLLLGRKIEQLEISRHAALDGQAQRRLRSVR